MEDYLNPYLDGEIRRAIEESYYASTNAQARLEQILRDPDFLDFLLQSPDSNRGAVYVPLWSDHGVVHARDVAHQVLQVLDTINGLLVPRRDAVRLEWMKAYGVCLAYIHDIGMRDFSPFGRIMHPEFAAQAVLGPDFDSLIDQVWNQDPHGLSLRLVDLSREGFLCRDPKEILRELLALACLHSKSKAPIELLGQPVRLRRFMQRIAVTPLEELYRLSSSPAADGSENTASLKGFEWLELSHGKGLELVRDAIDTLRALRSADALRQRGTVLKTSGQYEIYIDQTSGNAIISLRLEEDRLFLLEVTDPVSAGEANIASSELDRSGDVRISFQRGAFPDREVTRHAAYCAARVVADVYNDVIESFRLPAGQADPVLKTSDGMHVLLECPDDNPSFTDQVIEELWKIQTRAAAQTRSVISLRNIAALERERYQQASELPWNLAARQQALQYISASGHKIGEIDLQAGFQDVKIIQVHAGETLIEAGSPSALVYIPLDEGLEIIPLGGYQSFQVKRWMPLGITGVIRGAPRNASVVARDTVSLLAIPKEVYLKHWHATYRPAELAEVLFKLR